MINRETTSCFTGHRPEKMPWRYDEEHPMCMDLKKRIYDTVESIYFSGIRHYICGMANGADFYFAEAVCKLRDEKPDITIEAAIPWRGQPLRWRDEDKERYNKLLNACDYETLIQAEYSSTCMIRRNEYMVDNSSVIIAAYAGSKGGTMRTLLYAMRQNIEIIELPIIN